MVGIPSQALANTGTFTLGSNICTIDGTQITMNVSTYAKNNRTYLPVRYVAYAVGIPDENITWQADKQLVTLIRDNVNMAQLQIGSKIMTTSEGQISMDVAPEAVNGRVFLPVAYIAEAFDHKAMYDPATQTVTIIPKSTTYIGTNLIPKNEDLVTWAFNDWLNYSGLFKHYDLASLKILNCNLVFSDRSTLTGTMYCTVSARTVSGLAGVDYYWIKITNGKFEKSHINYGTTDSPSDQYIKSNVDLETINRAIYGHWN